MIVHGSTLSPFVRKVMAFAAEKGIAVENRMVGLGPKTPAFLAMSPFGKIPAFEDGDFALSDSSAIVHYLEALHPAPALIPAEPRARGRTIWFDEFADTIMLPAIGPAFFNRVVAPLLGMDADPAAADRACADSVPPVFAYLERVIPASGFLVDDALTLADIAVASPLVNARHAGIAFGDYPRLDAYVATMLARPSFAAAIAADAAILQR